MEALAAAYSSKSALLKHEIAYVMGQMQDAHAVPDREARGHGRGPHGETRGCRGARRHRGQGCHDNAKRFVSDPEPVISESCEVAIDLLEYVASKSLDYGATE